MKVLDYVCCLVQSVRDRFSGEDTKKRCEGISQDELAEYAERNKRVEELNREAKKWEDWAKRF